MAVERFRRTELDGGLLVLTEEVPGVRSVSTGVWVRAGSAHEALPELGVSHLLEHMVFKGSARRSARDFALALERLGGSLDAYTTREHTCYSARILDDHLETGIDVLSDLVLNPRLLEEDLELEREVVLEEISTVEDTPDDLIFDMHSELLWGGHPYGFPILGTRATVGSLSADDLRRLHAKRYRRPNLVIAAAGHVRHDPFLELVERHFTVGNGGERPAVPAPEAPPAAEHRVTRDSAQTHLVFGTPTFGHRDRRRYALALITSAFGGGMSSRLFQRVREELGLAYAVYAFQTFYHGAGLCGVYVGTRHEWAERAVDVVREEYRRLAAHGLTAEELADAKSQLKGSLVLSLESTGARLHRLAGYALYEEPYLTLDELTARVDAVSGDEVAEVAAGFLDPARQTLVRLGPDSR
ncbi:MAG TPA: pitrilysin family protein [Longimicrobiales bacterium]|nr:pitrilysin family protein [Longimicrobiales bacterium]